MGVTVSTTSTNAKLAKRATLKSWLKISTSTAFDEQIDDLLVMASDAVRAHCDRLFETQVYSETLPGDGSQILVLSHRPIISISSVALSGSLITDYAIQDKEAGFLYREAGWQWTIAAYAGTLGPQPVPSGFLNDFTVVYKAGYNLPGDTATDTGVLNLPGSVEKATLDTVKSWFKSRSEVADVRSKKIGPFEKELALSIEASKDGIPRKAEALLRKFESVSLWS